MAEKVPTTLKQTVAILQGLKKSLTSSLTKIDKSISSSNEAMLKEIKKMTSGKSVPKPGSAAAKTTRGLKRQVADGSGPRAGSGKPEDSYKDVMKDSAAEEWYSKNLMEDTFKLLNNYIKLQMKPDTKVTKEGGGRGGPPKLPTPKPTDQTFMKNWKKTQETMLEGWDQMKDSVSKVGHHLDNMVESMGALSLKGIAQESQELFEHYKESAEALGVPVKEIRNLIQANADLGNSLTDMGISATNGELVELRANFLQAGLNSLKSSKDVNQFLKTIKQAENIFGLGTDTLQGMTNSIRTSGGDLMTMDANVLQLINSMRKFQKIDPRGDFEDNLKEVFAENSEMSKHIASYATQNGTSKKQISKAIMEIGRVELAGRNLGIDFSSMMQTALTGSEKEKVGLRRLGAMLQKTGKFDGDIVTRLKNVVDGKEKAGDVFGEAVNALGSVAKGNKDTLVALQKTGSLGDVSLETLRTFPKEADIFKKKMDAVAATKRLNIDKEIRRLNPLMVAFQKLGFSAPMTMMKEFAFDMNLTGKEMTAMSSIALGLWGVVAQGGDIISGAATLMRGFSSGVDLMASSSKLAAGATTSLTVAQRIQLVAMQAGAVIRAAVIGWYSAMIPLSVRMNIALAGQNVALALQKVQLVATTVAGWLYTSAATAASVATNVLGVAVRFALGPIGLAMMAISGLVAVYYNWDKVSSVVVAGLKGLLSIITTVGDFIVTGLILPWKLLGNVVLYSAKGIAMMVTELTGFAGLEGVVKGMGEWFDYLAAKIMKPFQTMKDFYNYMFSKGKKTKIDVGVEFNKKYKKLLDQKKITIAQYNAEIKLRTKANSFITNPQLKEKVKGGADPVKVMKTQEMINLKKTKGFSTASKAELQNQAAKRVQDKLKLEFSSLKKVNLRKSSKPYQLGKKDKPIVGVEKEKSPVAPIPAEEKVLKNDINTQVKANKTKAKKEEKKEKRKDKREKDQKDNTKQTDQERDQKRFFDMLVIFGQQLNQLNNNFGKVANKKFPSPGRRTLANHGGGRGDPT